MKGVTLDSTILFKDLKVDHSLLSFEPSFPMSNTKRASCLNWTTGCSRTRSILVQNPEKEQMIRLFTDSELASTPTLRSVGDEVRADHS